MIERDRAAVFPRISPRTAGASTNANQRASAVSTGAQAVADIATGGVNPAALAFRKIMGLFAGQKPSAETEHQIQRILWATAEDQRPALISMMQQRGIVSNQEANALMASRSGAAPVTNALLQSMQN